MDSKFWETMNLLVGPEFKRKTVKEMMDDVQDWVEKVATKKDSKMEYLQIIVDCDEESMITGLKRAYSSSKSSTYGTESFDDDVKEFLKKLNLPKIDCNFCHPHVKARLERLMESNLVSLTDRLYMTRLCERIMEDSLDSMEKRIREREFEETERIKNLVLSGKIPMSQAPASMAEHPVMIIEKYCEKIIAERRKKIKIPKVHIPELLYFDDTPDPPSGLSIEYGHRYRPGTDELCQSVLRFVDPHDLEPEKQKSVEKEGKGKKTGKKSSKKGTKDKPIKTKDKGKDKSKDKKKGKGKGIKADQKAKSPEAPPYMYVDEDFQWLKYETQLIKQLKNCVAVEEMYNLADEIIGELQTITATDKTLYMEEGEEDEMNEEEEYV